MLSIKFKTLHEFSLEGADATDIRPRAIHSGNAGDIIYSLPTARMLGVRHFYLNVCNDLKFEARVLDEKSALSLAQLLLNQPVIDKVSIVSAGVPLEYVDNNAIDIDYVLDRFRLEDTERLHLILCHAKAMNVRLDLNEPFIELPEHLRPQGKTSSIVMVRTTRHHYLSDEFMARLMAHFDDILILGLAVEAGCVKAIPGRFHECQNFIEMAEIISGAKVFIGNPSLPYAIAEGLKVPRIIDIPTSVANAFPIGPRGYLMPPNIDEAVALTERLLRDHEHDNVRGNAGASSIAVNDPSKSTHLQLKEGSEPEPADTMIHQSDQDANTDHDIVLLNQRLDIEIRRNVEIINSLSWRLSAPVRWAGKVLKFLKSWCRWRLHRMSLKPSKDIEEVEGGYKSIGNDPQFDLVSNHRRSPCGWVALSYDGEAKIGALIPKLYLNLGNGFSDHDCICLPLSGPQTMKEVIRFPDKVVALRFDPFERPGFFGIDDFVIREIGFIQLLYFVTLPKLKQVLFRPSRAIELGKETCKILSAGGLVALKHHVFPHNKWFVPYRDYPGWVAYYDVLTDDDRAAIRERILQLRFQPVISILLCADGAEKNLIRQAIDSILQQLYPHWELSIVCSGSSAEQIGPIIRKYQGKDKRIKFSSLNQDHSSAACRNHAMDLASGEFVAIIESNSKLSEHALYMVAEEINAHPDVAMIYTDEDRIDENGRRYDPCFKPDWNSDLFYSHNFVSKLCVFRRTMVKGIGDFNSGFDGDEDYEFILRLITHLSDIKILHIPHILYHRLPQPHAQKREKEGGSAIRDAISKHIPKSFGVVELKEMPGTSFSRVIHKIAGEKPLVSLIIPTKDKVSLLRGCVEGILNETDYDNVEVIIVDNRSIEQETLTYLETISENPCVKVLNYDAPYDFSAINNMAARSARGQILAFINNDIEIISGGWLTEMVSHALRPDIGAVGAKLYYPDETIQHAGVVLGIGGVAGHIHKNLPRNDPGYCGRLNAIQTVSAVTAACMVLRRAVFEEVGGMIEQHLAVAFNDVDLCMRIRDRGYRIIWTPFAELRHLESATRGQTESNSHQQTFVQEIQYMKYHWGDALLNDPFYNPNLTLARDDCSLSFPPRVSMPWRGGGGNVTKR